MSILLVSTNFSFLIYNNKIKLQLRYYEYFQQYV